MTKIDIISGFLGAGKTTFIKKMIDEVFKGEKIVLIENEFGEVGIDGGFLKDAGIQITEMNSGCICCSLVGDFGRNLHEVIDKYHPDRILIEPSGVGKLSDVMKSVIDIEKEEDVKLNGLVTVVNALKASKQMKAFGEFFNNQIEFATVVVLSRSQSATPEQLELCVKQIQALNPKAAIITTPWDSIKGEQILKVIEGADSLEMKLMAEHLRDTGVTDDQIIEMNFESMGIPDMDARGFYEYVKARICPDKRTYLFFDEVQKVHGWENAVNSFRVDFDCDIYITGSNAYLLSSELSTYLSGRYVEIKVLPLSFREFLDFHGYVLTERKSPAGGFRKRITDAEGETYDVKELFDAYARFGGMPMLADVGLEIDRVTAALDGVYSAAVINDILEREKRKGQRNITDPVLLKKIILFLADNIGNNTSATSIGNTLVNEGLLENGTRKTKPAVQTIQAYIEALTEAYIFYEIKRFDIKGKEYLRTLGKYYIVDIGLRNYLLGYRDGDSGHILENIIYFELLRRGYDVAIGKIDNQEVDFIATKADEKKYVQVTESMNAPETRERELAPLRKIRDSYEKIVIALECNLTQSQDGIKIIRALDFLLE